MKTKNEVRILHNSTKSPKKCLPGRHRNPKRCSCLDCFPLRNRVHNRDSSTLLWMPKPLQISCFRYFQYTNRQECFLQSQSTESIPHRLAHANPSDKYLGFHSGWTHLKAHCSSLQTNCKGSHVNCNFKWSRCNVR